MLAGILVLCGQAACVEHSGFDTRVLKMILLNENVQVNVDLIMEEEMPENLIKKKQSENVQKIEECRHDKVPLNFSVERLLSDESEQKNCDNMQSLRFPSMPTYGASTTTTPTTTTPYGYYQSSYNTGLDPKILVKPTPIRMLSNAPTTTAERSTLSTPLQQEISLMRFQQKSTQLAQALQSLMTLPHNATMTGDHFTNALHHSPTTATLLHPSQLCVLNQLHQQQQQHQQQNNYLHLRNDKNKSNTNTTITITNSSHNFSDMTATNAIVNAFHHQQQHQQHQQQHNKQVQRTSNNNNNNNNSNIGSSSGNGNKRKRSWSRAVFSNLQRKGLEIQFQQQKYITKPDRRKLAARLNLTDAQVKVWFQNRRMKWRHTRENLKSGQEKLVPNSGVTSTTTTTPLTTTTTTSAASTSTTANLLRQLKQLPTEGNNHSYSSADGYSSAEGSDQEDNDEGDIDVVE